MLVQPLSVGAGTITWFSAQIIDHNGASLNVLPTALQANNGTLWLAWESNKNAGGTSRFDIFYKTRTGNNWSSDFNLTGSGWNAAPGLAQLQNGTILVFWTSNPTGTSCSPQCNLYYERFSITSNKWSASTQLSNGLFNDSQSYASVGRDGTLWLVWTRIVTNCSVTPCSVTKQLFYRTLKNNNWSAETQLTTDSNWNSYSNVVVGKDGVVRVVFSKSPSSSEIGQLYIKTYNGAWSSETQIVSSSSSDENPSIIQDRNGTFWTFWARKFYYNSLNFQYILYNKFSVDNGNTWSSENQMTTFAQTVDAKMPFAVQANSASSKAIWLFYSSNYLFNVFDIYAIQSSYISPIHDVTISQIVATPSLGWSGTISVTVVNLGDFADPVSVTVTLTNSTTTFTLGPGSGSVPIGGSINIVLPWSSSTVTIGKYSATATVAPVPGETLANQGDNSLQVNNLVTIIPMPPTFGTPGGTRPKPV